MVQVGDDFSTAQRHADVLGAERGLVFVYPFDDPLVVAGQGTIADELRRQCHGRLSAVFVPVGGGGLIAGIAGYFKTLLPAVRVIGVEPFDSDAMYQSLAAGRRVGELLFAIATTLVDEIVRVSNDEICAAIKDIFDDTRSIMEPAGALAVAGLKTWMTRGRGPDLRLAAILSGANMNFERLRFVAERAELREAREAVFAVTISERPGAFREFCAAIGPRVITEFNYRLSRRYQAHIFVGVRTTSREDARVLRQRLIGDGHRPDGPLG